jgi:hypothetical protein
MLSSLLRDPAHPAHFPSRFESVICDGSAHTGSLPAARPSRPTTTRPRGLLLPAICTRFERHQVTTKISRSGANFSRVGSMPENIRSLFRSDKDRSDDTVVTERLVRFALNLGIISSLCFLFADDFPWLKSPIVTKLFLYMFGVSTGVLGFHFWHLRQKSK